MISLASEKGLLKIVWRCHKLHCKFLDWLQLCVINDKAVEKTFDLMTRARCLDIGRMVGNIEVSLTAIISEFPLRGRRSRK